MTPWAGCIKEGIEPRISQKWFFLSHAQVRFLLFSLLLLLFCFCFSCSYCYYYYYYGYLLAKGFYNSSGYEYKPRHFNKQNFSLLLCFLPLFALFSLSLSSDAIVCVYCYLTHTMSPALLLTFARCIICVHGYLTHIMSPALLLTFARCLSLSLSLFSDGHCVCSRLFNPHNVTSLASHFCLLHYMC